MVYTREEIIQPSGLDQSASSSIEGLKNRLRMNTGQNIALAQQQAAALGAERGAKEGMALDEEGRAIAPELKAGVTAFQQAFNNSAIDGYKASLQADIRNDIGRIYQENSDDAEMFSKKIDAYQQGISDDVHPEVRDEVLFAINKEKNNLGLKVAENDLLRKQKEAIDGHNENITSAFEFAKRAAENGEIKASSDYAAEAFLEIDKKLENGYINEDEAVQAKLDIERSLMESVTRRDLRNVYEAEGESAAYSKLYELGENVPEWSNVEDWEAFTNSLVADLNQQVTLQKKIVTQEEIARDKKIADLFVAAENPYSDLGKITFEFEKLISEGTQGGEKRVSSEQIKSFYRTIQSRQIKEIENLNEIDAVSRKWKGEASNGRIVVTQKGVNSYYNDVLLNFEDLDNAMKADFVSVMGMIPLQMKRQMKQYILSRDPQLIIEAADLADRIQETPGIIDNVFSTHEQALAKRVVELSDVMDPEKAVENALIITDPNNKANIDLRKSEITEKFKKNDSADVEDYFESRISKWDYRAIPGLGTPIKLDPVNKARITREFQDVRDSLYIANFGTKEESDEQALKQVARNWGEFKFGEKNIVMKYPMQLYYMSDGGTDYIAEQAEELATDALGYEVKAKDIIFVSDQRTAREAKMREKTGKGGPTYLMSILKEDGTLVRTGKRFYPDVLKANEDYRRLQDDIAVENRTIRENLSKNIKESWRFTVPSFQGMPSAGSGKSKYEKFRRKMQAKEDYEQISIQLEAVDEWLALNKRPSQLVSKSEINRQKSLKADLEEQLSLIGNE